MNALDSSFHNLPQHIAGDAVSIKQAPAAPLKPCHTAKLALLCVQNVVQMGAPNQLDLCPPGRARRDLLKALRDRRRRKKSGPGAALPMRRSLSFGSRNASLTSVGSRVEETSAFEKLMGESGVEEYDKFEAEFLNDPSIYARENKTRIILLNPSVTRPRVSHQPHW